MPERLLPLLLLPLLLPSACASVPAAAPPGEVPIHGAVPGRICSGERLEGFTGQPASSEVGARILAASEAARLRWLAHGTITTMEYDESRVTVRLDPQNRIVTARCG